MTPDQLRLWRKAFTTVCDSKLAELTADLTFNRYRRAERQIDLLLQWRQSLGQESQGRTIQ